MSGWRIGATVSEAVRNVTAAPARLVPLGVAIAMMMAGLTWTELLAVSEARGLAETYAARGGYIAVVDGPRGVSASACEGLTANPHVVSAGGYRGGSQVSAAHAPRIAFQRLEVTSGVLAVWDPSANVSPVGGIIVGAAAATELGLVQGSWVSRIGAEPATINIVDPSVRNPPVARAFLDIVPPSGRLDQCWAELEPQAMGVFLPSLAAHFAPDEVEVRRAVSRDEFAFSPSELIERRPQRWAWLLAGLVGIAMMSLAALYRRADTALYRAFGLGRLSELVMHQVESIIIAAGAYVLASAWTVALYGALVGTPDLEQTLFALRASGLTAALIGLIAPLGAFVAASGSPAVLLKDR